MKRRGCLIWGGAALFGLPTLLGVGLLSAAFLSIRSPGSDQGADPESWVIIGVAVVLGSLVMAAIGAGLGWLAAKLLGNRAAGSEEGR
ncbi:hypothetical protein [Brevundimonas sp.]|uniref:hypothetical protein n=1 Tax=Brevundimonas sp. TaxID=1871086 RepID=UPI0025EB1924|nr:hypothetical protein [Brevundimonas sp.]